jgi:hypothetical protein
MPFANRIHLSVDYVISSFDYGNTFIDCTDFSVDFATKSNVCANNLDDWVNISIHLADALDNSHLDFCFPNPSLLQLLSTYSLVVRSCIINIVLTIRSSIHSSFSLLRIYGLCMSHFLFSTFV